MLQHNRILSIVTGQVMILVAEYGSEITNVLDMTVLTMSL